MNGMEGVGVIRIIVYHLLRNKLIPLMDETQIDLKSIFNKDLLKDVKLLKDEDLVYFLIIRGNILKRYRDGILSGRIKFQEFADSKFKYRVNCSIIPEFLNFIGLETLDNHQRGKLFKKLIKHIYKSQVELSDEALDEYFQRLKVPAREQFKITHETNHFTISFERILFERETYTISHHVVSFPSFPSTNIEKIKETTNESLSWLTKKGKIDHCWTSTCCYSSSPEEDIVKCMQGCGMPKWIGTLTNFVCCYRHRLFPMLDCSHMFDLCFSLSDDSTIRSRYEQLYSKLESKPNK